jgi:putative acetyltransferase
MTITVRPMRPEDAGAGLEVHRAAIHGTAAKDYPQSILQEWGPLPVTVQTVKRFQANPDNEIRLIAEQDGEIVGFGALVPENNKLRACYVAPRAGRKGVGSALVRELERLARARGLAQLQLESSITAEPFYNALGYEARERGEHTLRSGRRMACVKMRKLLQP